jgi:ferrous iron transport protein B
VVYDDWKDVFMIQDHTALSGASIKREAAERRIEFQAAHGRAAEKVIAQMRYQTADRIAQTCVVRADVPRRTLTDWIDRFVCNRFAGPIILLGILYGIYQLAIVQGYNLTDSWWPVLATLKNAVLSILPGEGLLVDPMFRSLVVWTLNGVLAVLNYIPIFAILFALVAILEDTGYMARIAFVLDRLLRPFGLHGQSALPLMLGGLFVGGCAIPGVMACRGIKDERARMTTMLVVPLMNCLAKIPFYLLLIGLFFSQVSGLMMFMMSTITLLFALSVSKVLSLTVLRNRPVAPFVLELPVYHLPTLQNVLRRVVERLWIFVKKITTVVAVVMVVLFVLLNLPRLNDARATSYEVRLNDLLSAYSLGLGEMNPYVALMFTKEGATAYAQFASGLRSAKRSAVTDEEVRAVERSYLARNPEFFKVATKGRMDILADEEVGPFAAYLEIYQQAYVAYLVEYPIVPVAEQQLLKQAFFASWETEHPFFFSLARMGTVYLRGGIVFDSDAMASAKAFVAVDRGARALQSERHQEQLETGILGRLGIAMEPLTRLAGFNWRVNIGLIGAFAAKESVVATLGSIYGAGVSEEETESLESQIEATESGWTSLHAVSMMLFMALYPPCIAALLMIKVQAGWRWMLFALVYPTVLVLLISILVFSGGQLLGLSGLSAMIALYVAMLLVTVLLGLINPKRKQPVCEEKKC